MEFLLADLSLIKSARKNITLEAVNHLVDEIRCHRDLVEITDDQRSDNCFYKSKIIDRLLLQKGH